MEAHAYGLSKKCKHCKIRSTDNAVNRLLGFVIDFFTLDWTVHYYHDGHQFTLDCALLSRRTPLYSGLCTIYYHDGHQFHPNPYLQQWLPIKFDFR